MNNIEFKLALHARLCDLADILMLQYNPCRAADRACLMGKNPIPCCTHTRFKRFDGSEFCYYLGDDGCQVMNIYCKTWFCEEAEKNLPHDFLVVMWHLKEIARIYGLIEEGQNERA